MDDNSFEVALKAQRDDINDLEQAREVTKEFAELQRQQLSLHAGVEASKRLVTSIAKAVASDGPIIARLTRRPQIDDITLARLAAMNHPPFSSTHQPNQVLTAAQATSTASINLGRRKQDKLSTPGDSGLSSAKEGGPILQSRSPIATEGDVPSSKRTNNISCSQDGLDSSCDWPTNEFITTDVDESIADDSDQKKLICVSCSNEDITTDLVKVACKPSPHCYCRECFEGFVGSFLKVQDSFPPSCCKKPLAFQTIALNVSPELFKKYHSRLTEFQDKVKVYCSDPKCSARIPIKNIYKSRARCASCYRNTCTKCKGEIPKDREKNHICQKDPQLEELLALADKEGWQTCYRCDNMVGLTFGCHHMKCRCSAEFCYICGLKWKGCNGCPRFDNERVRVRAGRILELRDVRRHQLGLREDTRPLAERIAEANQLLRVDCDHNNIEYLEKHNVDPGYCLVCEYHGMLDKKHHYIMQCEDCNFSMCNFCHQQIRRTGRLSVVDGNLTAEDEDTTDVENDQPNGLASEQPRHLEDSPGDV